MLSAEAPMYLGKKLNNGTHYLCLLTSERVPGKKYPRVKVIHNFGKLDMIAPATMERLEDKELRKLLSADVSKDILNGNVEAAVQKVVVGEWESTNFPASHQSSINFNKLPFLHYGHLLLRPIWDDIFRLKYKLDYIQEKKSKIRAWDLNSLLFYFATSKVMDPRSYHSLYQNKENFFYCPWEDTNIDSFYSSLEFIDKHHDDIIKYSVNQYIRERKKSINITFFDCTNTWFETSTDDEVKFKIEFYKTTTGNLRREGKFEDEINAYISSEEYANDLQKALDKNRPDIIRMKGCSKEGRYSQPLVMIALAMDQEGFPIDCQVFAGNTAEVKTIPSIIDSLKEKYEIKDIYFVADKGLNSVENLDFIFSQKLGYIISQKIYNQKSKFLSEILDINGYKNIYNDCGILRIADDNLIENELRFKVCDSIKTAYVEKGDGSKTKSGRPARKKVSHPCKIMYIFNPKRKERDLHQLKLDVARAQKAVDMGISMSNPYKSGWRAFVQTQKEVDDEATDVNEMYRAVGLKQDIIDERTKLAGFSAIVFTHPAEQKFPLSDIEILEKYHKLVGIEDNFRIMKSNFSIHPVNVYTASHIRGHCYLCFLSLMLLRALEKKLDKIGRYMSSNRISEVLHGATLIPIPDGRGEIQLWNACSSENTYNTNIFKKGKFKNDNNKLDSFNSITEKYISERSTEPDDLDAIIQAVGLQPLQIRSSMGQVKKALGMGSMKKDVMIAKSLQARLGLIEKNITPMPHTPAGGE